MAMSGEPRCIMITAPVLGENWANISDPVERRRAQNRIAQRGYRKRLRKMEEEAAQNKQNNNRTKTSVEPINRLPPSPPEAKLPQPQITKQEQLPAITTPPPSRPSSQPYALPHPHQSQTPRLPDLHQYTPHLDHVTYTGRPWTPSSMEEEANQPIFHMKTPRSDPAYSTSHKLPQPFHPSTEAGLLCSPPVPPVPAPLPTPRVSPETSDLPRSGDTSHGHTALHRAALYGHESVLTVLLQAGADPTLPDSTGLTPLHLAAQQGHARVVQLLLSHGPQHQDMVSQATSTGETSLHLAVQAQQPAVARVLIEHSARAVNDQDWWGRTALHMACESNQQELVEMLVHAGAQLDIRDFEGQTLLHSACMAPGL
ncbi:hypothetical protein N7540_004510 [Penicillium herquei]|nr:hypothetical protein N7540_004510 [Penicillium herquei]